MKKQITGQERKKSQENHIVAITAATTTATASTTTTTATTTTTTTTTTSTTLKRTKIKVQTLNMGSNITCTITCNHRIAATLYTLKTWFVSGT